ncbi:N-acylneuraminate cytidylyltransferase [Agrobacterium sp. DSM 25558]|uniref:cytidylyltransferase domain-containing protein n=1 Tax=Agrobacterium sp. DSM 25558 TaxID=1907665 RepID=UPI00097253A6|nr:hypothetical protein [Agrobacterium sp. DSM 25558]SCX27173.1 N-acylneuraminate cytidylyltransferase [Agrobacterium sp. DSM 25558]
MNFEGPKLDVVAYVPARRGSVRVAVKNLRVLGDRPLLHYVLNTLKNVKNLDRAYVNTESSEIASSAQGLCDIYIRPAELATSSTKTDEILYDFAKNVPSRSVAVVNPTAPFLSETTIERAVNLHLERNRETIFTTTLQRKHLIYGGQPVNFPINTLSPRTQELKPFEYINFIIFVIDSQRLIKNYEEKGFCLYEAPLNFMPMDGIECHDIDDEIDFQIAEALIERNKRSIEYDKSIDALMQAGANFAN